jgi:acetoin utilization deacetylase AcuC-like enzyme
MAGALAHPSVAGRCRDVPCRPAAPDELAWIHAPDYIERVAATAGRTLSTFDIDTQATAGSYEAARLAVGAVFALTDAIMAGEGKRGFACVRPPGHHAEPDRAMGFCLFNNAALGAARLKHRHGLDRVLIVDIDAHHGNGIQKAFYDTDEVLYISAHGFPGYPGTGNLGEVGVGRGEGYTVNIPLGKGQIDRVFGRIIGSIVRPLAEAYRPQMMLVACGFDLYTHDRLGQMNVTPNGYGLMARLLTDIADAVCDGRILFVLEGGYSIRGISECGLRLAQELTDVSAADTDKILNGRNGNWLTGDAVRKVMAVQARYWPGCFI